MVAPREGQLACAADDQTVGLIRVAARMLLEYSARSSMIVSQVGSLAASIGAEVSTVVSYRGVCVHLADGRTLHVQAPEYRLNVAVSAALLACLNEIRAGRISPGAALERIESLPRMASQHGRFVLALLFGLAASALACILRADLGAIAISGISSILGLLARQAMGRRHWPIFSLPFAAGIISGVVGGCAIQLGWTRTPALCLVVPALMLVPGPHLIIGIYDIIDNHIQTGLCRLTLAAGIIAAAAMGVMGGAWAVSGPGSIGPATSSATELTLWLDVLLAGMAACGFGAFYNSPWRVLLISMGCGMVGHGIRFLAMAEGAELPGATLLACVAIGVLAGAVASRFPLTFASIAFAAAVPMMPGTLFYRSIRETIKLSSAGASGDAASLNSAVVPLLQAGEVVGAMAVGLLAGPLIVSAAGRAVRSLRDFGAAARPGH